MACVARIYARAWDNKVNMVYIDVLDCVSPTSSSCRDAVFYGNCNEILNLKKGEMSAPGSSVPELFLI